MEAKISAQQFEPISRATVNEDFIIPRFPKPNRFPHAQLVLCLNYAIAHFFAIVGLVFICQGQVRLSTLVFVEIFSILSGLGITVGAHRLFAHRSFKAKPPLKILLTILFTSAGQQSIWLWNAWHRVHHKFSDTDADPHNSKRGFFYSHVGWLLIYDHEAFLENLKKVDMSDLESDPIVMFHKKHYTKLHIPFVYIIPTLITWYFFGEALFTSFCVGACLKYCWLAHKTFLIGSAAHLWGGMKPYDTSIRPAENKLLAYLTLGEGWHNYHHVFPWDYKTAELGQYRWNFSTAFIDFFALIGWAYDLKTVPKETVMNRVKRTGNHHDHHSGPWGWGDVDIPEENILVTETLYPGKDL